MKTYIHLTNNETIVVDDKELKSYVRFGAYWLGILYKNKPEKFIPNTRISSVERKIK